MSVFGKQAIVMADHEVEHDEYHATLYLTSEVVSRTAGDRMYIADFLRFVEDFSSVVLEDEENLAPILSLKKGSACLSAYIVTPTDVVESIPVRKMAKHFTAATIDHHQDTGTYCLYWLDPHSKLFIIVSNRPSVDVLFPEAISHPFYPISFTGCKYKKIVADVRIADCQFVEAVRTMGADSNLLCINRAMFQARRAAEPTLGTFPPNLSNSFTALVLSVLQMLGQIKGARE